METAHLMFHFKMKPEGPALMCDVMVVGLYAHHWFKVDVSSPYTKRGWNMSFLLIVFIKDTP